MYALAVTIATVVLGLNDVNKVLEIDLLWKEEREARNGDGMDF